MRKRNRKKIHFVITEMQYDKCSTNICTLQLVAIRECLTIQLLTLAYDVFTFYIIYSSLLLFTIISIYIRKWTHFQGVKVTIIKIYRNLQDGFP